MELPFEEPDMGKGLVAELREENKRLREAIEDAIGRYQVTHIHAVLRKALEDKA